MARIELPQIMVELGFFDAANSLAPKFVPKNVFLRLSKEGKGVRVYFESIFCNSLVNGPSE